MDGLTYTVIIVSKRWQSTSNHGVIIMQLTNVVYLDDIAEYVDEMSAHESKLRLAVWEANKTANLVLMDEAAENLEAWLDDTDGDLEELLEVLEELGDSGHYYVVHERVATNKDRDNMIVILGEPYYYDLD